MPTRIEDKLNGGRQYRSIDITNFELRASENGALYVEGYASTFNEPYELYSYNGYTVNEQIDARAFDDTDMSDVIFQYNHEGRVFARKSNGTLDVTPDQAGLHIRANLGGTDAGRDLYEEIKGGYTTKMSIGFVVGEDKREVTEDHENNTITVLRTITKVKKLYDVSAVSIPANDATSISARNFCDGLIEEIESERQTVEKRERQKHLIKIMLNM